jgi:type IV secretion system protein VirB9
VTRLDLVAPLAIVLALAAPAAAEVTPRSTGGDPHLVTVGYDPANVVRIVSSRTSSTQLIFSAHEEITNVAIGDADAWLAQPAGHLLFLKPTLVRAPTNAQVVTKLADGTLRTYQLRLVASPGARRARPMYAVTFTYPREAAAAAQAARERAAQERLARAWAEGPRNWRYVAKGSKQIEPTEVSDNGRMTAFRFPGNMRVPTIYTRAPDGQETIVPYTVQGEHAVVGVAAREFVLRDGRQVLRIINQGFDPVGRNPGTGTGTRDLTRVVRSPAP